MRIGKRRNGENVKEKERVKDALWQNESKGQSILIENFAIARFQSNLNFLFSSSFLLVPPLFLEKNIT